MAANLVFSILQSLTPDMVTKIAMALGLDRNVAEKAIGAGIPAILASFAGLASTPAGAEQLSGALTQQQPGALDQLKNALNNSGAGQKNFADSGSGLLSVLLGGGGLATLAGALGNSLGMSTDTVKSLLGFLGPVVAGGLGQRQRSAGLDASGLASMLASQKDQIKAAMPSSLAGALDSSGLLEGLSGGVRRGADAASAAAGRSADILGGAYANANQAASAAARRTSTSALPYLILGLAALAALGWYLFGRPGEEQNAAVQQPASQSTETVGKSGAANISVTDLTNDLSSSVSSVKTTLQGITDSASARAALPKLEQATAQLDRVSRLKAQLPSAAQLGLTSSVAAAMPTVKQLCDRALSTPGVAGVAKPTIEALRAKLEALSQA